MGSVNLIKSIFIVVTMITMGCQAVMNTPAGPTDRTVDTKRSSSPAYYYFSASQIELKKGDVNEAIWHLKQALKYDPRSAFLRIELANLYLIKKEDAPALEQIREILERQPDHVPALITYGRIHQQRKETDAAKAAFEKVLGIDPEQQHIYLLLGRIYWEANDSKETARVFKQMVSHFPDHYTSHYFHGKALSAEGDLAGAEKALLTSLVLEPALKEPRTELLKIYKKQNQTDKITSIYNELRQLEPKNPVPALGLAEHYRKHDDEPGARKILSEMGAQVQDNKDIIPAVFEAYIDPKKNDQALWVLTAMLAGNPDHPDLNYLAGVAANGLGRDALALDHMAKVAPLSRFYQSAIIQSAIIYHDGGQIDHAIAVVKKAISHAPDNADYYLYLGSFYEELERYDDALKWLQQGLDVDEANARLHFKVGLIYDRMGRKKASIASLRRVLQLAPDDAEALNYLGYTYADMGINLDEAKSLIQSALALKPNDGYITDSLGWVYYKQGLYSEALRWLKKAMVLVPDDPTILEHLGDVYLKMNSKQKARSFYQRSLEKKNNGSDALKSKIRALDAD